MPIILEPLAPPELAPITVTDAVFAIGRDCDVIREWGPAVTGALAPVQAIVFQDRGRWVVLVAGSGVARNGSPIDVGRSIELQSGDELGFRDALKLRIVPGDPGVRVRPPPMMQVSLVPIGPIRTGETIVLETLPFLISRNTPLFREYAAIAPEEVRALSRRHAILFQRFDRLLLMDLGSTNGTRLGSRALEPFREATVGHDDSILIGGNQFGFRVQVQTPDDEDETRIVSVGAPAPDDLTVIAPVAPTAADAPVAGARNAPQPDAAAGAVATPVSDRPDAVSAPGPGVRRVGDTVYIRTADAYLDLFLDEPVNEPASDGPGPAPKPKPVGRARAFVGELREALADDVPPPRRRILRWVAAAVMLATAAGGYYVYSSPQREIAGLLKKEQFHAGFLRAGGHLERHPGDTQLEALATEALAGWLLPAWHRAVTEGRFDAADSLLAEAAAGGPLYPESARVLELLSLVLDIERFDARRGGAGAPLTAFRDEGSVSELLQRWDAGASAYELLLVKLANHVPSFQDQRTRSLSGVRSLRNDQTVYVNALGELRRNLDLRLTAGELDQAVALVKGFERQYPRIIGLGMLEADILRLKAFTDALDGNDPDVLIGLGEARFESPWVEDFAHRSLYPHMPNAKFLQRYQDALQAWRDGEPTRAIGILEAMSGAPAEALVGARLQHFRFVTEAMRELQEARGQPGHDERLLRLARDLDPVLDSHVLDMMGAELGQVRGEVLREIDMLHEQARESWQAYRDGGGISGLMRLENSISEPFRTQSQRLLEAYLAVHEAHRRFLLVQSPAPDDALQLHQSVVTEVRQQRRSFADLSLVLDPELLREKLNLLPEPEDF